MDRNSDRAYDGGICDRGAPRGAGGGGSVSGRFVDSPEREGRVREGRAVLAAARRVAGAEVEDKAGVEVRMEVEEGL